MARVRETRHGGPKRLWQRAVAGGEPFWAQQQPAVAGGGDVAPVGAAGAGAGAMDHIDTVPDAASEGASDVATAVQANVVPGMVEHAAAAAAAAAVPAEPAVTVHAMELMGRMASL